MNNTNENLEVKNDLENLNPENLDEVSGGALNPLSGRTCPKCGKVFWSPAELRRHQSEEH